MFRTVGLDEETRMPCPQCERCPKCAGRSIEDCVHCDALHRQKCALCAVCSLCCGTQMVTVSARRIWLAANPEPPPSAA